MARKRYRLRYSIASLLALVAMVAVVLTLCLPLIREDDRPPGHGSFVLTKANAAQCATCHKMSVRSLAIVPQPPNPRGGSLPAARRNEGLLAWLNQEKRGQGNLPMCTGANPSGRAKPAQCASCHAASKM
jgi:hypothetical protein